MATAYYGLNAGQHAQDVAVGSSTNSTDMEFKVDLSKVGHRDAIYLALQAIQQKLLSNAFPPL